MIQWTYNNAKQCRFIDELIVATDNHEIAETIRGIGGKVVMTDPHIETGSERVATVAKDYPDMDVIINLQGDEPFVTANMLETLISPYLNGETPDMTTLATTLDFQTEYHDPGIVKVITDQTGHAIYFSRAPIPYFRTKQDVPVYHHMGLYAFTRTFLLHYQTLKQTPLGQAESLEQLRVIEHGYKIKVCMTETKTMEINTQEEFEKAQHFKHEFTINEGAS